MPISDQEAERLFEERKNAMILAMFKVMMESEEFKEKFSTEFKRILSLSHQQDANTLLREIGYNYPDDDFPFQF